MRRALVLSTAWFLGCGQPADAPKAEGSATSEALGSAIAPTPFIGRFPQDCEHWPYDEALKAELIEKAFALLGGLSGTPSKSLLERIHPGGVLMVQILPRPEGGPEDKRETLVPRAEVLQYFAEGGGAWLLDGFLEPISAYRRPKVGAHWDVLDGHRQLCVPITGTVGEFDGKTYVVMYPTDKEQDEGRNPQVVVLFERDGRGTWLAAALIRPYELLE